MKSLAEAEDLKEPETRKYLQETVFPTLLPVLEELLRTVQKDIGNPNSDPSATLKTDPMIWLAQKIYRKHHGAEWKEVQDFFARQSKPSSRMPTAEQSGSIKSSLAIDEGHQDSSASVVMKTLVEEKTA